MSQLQTAKIGNARSWRAIWWISGADIFIRSTDYSQIGEESQKQSIEYGLKYIAKTKKVEAKPKLETPQEKYNALFPKKGDLEFYNLLSSEVTTVKAP